VPVVVHQLGDTSGQRQLAHAGETPTDPGKTCQPPQDCGILKALIAGHRYRGGGVEDIVAAGHIQAHGQWIPAARAMHHEGSEGTLALKPVDPVVGIFGNAVGDHLAADLA